MKPKYRPVSPMWISGLKWNVLKERTRLCSLKISWADGAGLAFILWLAHLLGRTDSCHRVEGAAREPSHLGSSPALLPPPTCKSLWVCFLRKMGGWEITADVTLAVSLLKCQVTPDGSRSVFLFFFLKLASPRMRCRALDESSASAENPPTLVSPGQRFSNFLASGT